MNNRDSGIYALLIHCNNMTIIVGKLGKIHFASGYYVYIGSAQKNLKKRIARHYRKNKKIKWHIDYLLQDAIVTMHITAPLPKFCEEKIAMSLQEQFAYVHGFGSSDSHAKSHLFYGEKEKNLG